MTALAALAEPCELTSHFAFDGFSVRFQTNSPQLKRQIDNYYHSFRSDVPHGRVICAFDGPLPELGGGWEAKPPEPGKHKVKEHLLRLEDAFVVRKIQTGVHLCYIGDQRICAGPLTANPNQVINFINNVYLDDLLAEQGQLFHAAGVCGEKRGVGLAGRSGKGKSTLALRLLEAGLDFTSNDRLVVHESGDGLAMHGVPKYPRINPGTIVGQRALLSLAADADIARYRAMPTEDLWELEEKHDAFIEEAFEGCRFRLEATMDAFVLIDWDRHHSGPPVLESVSASEVHALMPAVMKTPGPMLPSASRRIPQAAAEDYVDLLRKTEVLLLRGGVDFDRAAGEILDIVGLPDRAR